MPSTLRAIWTPEESPFGARRRRAAYAYEAYLPDPVADWDEPLSAALAAEVSDADRDLRSASSDISLAGIEALSRHLLRAESVASSRIEGLVVSHRRIAEAAFDPAHNDETARSVLGNIGAMERAVRLGSRRSAFRPADFSAIHRALFAETRDSAIAGHVRTTQNWIGGRSDGPAGAEFVPPPPDLVPALLADLARFCSRTDLPAVLQAAIAHAQFETIHPFPDGNGRVGRCLIHVVLRRGGHSGPFVPPVSLALAGDGAAYVKGLSDFRRGDVSAWIGTFAAAASLAARRSAEFADAVRAAVSRWKEEVRARPGSVLARAVAALAEVPVLDAARLATAVRCDPSAAHAALARLAAAGVVTETTLARRNRAFVARGCLELLNQLERSLLDRRGSRSGLRSPARPPTLPPQPDVSPSEAAVLRALGSAGLALSDLRTLCPIPARRLQSLLARLRRRGLVRLSGRARTARWTATAAGRKVLGAHGG